MIQQKPFFISYAWNELIDKETIDRLQSEINPSISLVKTSSPPPRR